MNASMVVGILFMVAGYVSLMMGLSVKFDLSKYVLKTEVVEAFKGEWNTQTFNCDGITLKSKDGEEKFYSVKDIDGRVAKLNKVLAK